MDYGGEEPQLAKVLKWMKNNESNTIGMANKNSILDTGVYEIEFQYGFYQPVDANLIDENFFAQVNKYGRRHKLIDMIKNVRENDKALKDEDEFYIS